MSDIQQARTRSETRPESTRLYSIAGVTCAVSASRHLLERVDATYGAFRAEPVESSDLAVTVTDQDGGFRVTDSDGCNELVDDERSALVVTSDRLVTGVIGRLAQRRVYALHAAALRHGDGVVIISGRSGAGKTTLALGLMVAGLPLLSDELALLDSDEQTVLPYRRAVHVRPGTPELIEPLRFLSTRPRIELGGGSEWALLPADLEHAFPGALGTAGPLTHVLLLEERQPGPARLSPLPAGIAALELMRATPTAAVAFDDVLARLVHLTGRAHCARLTPGDLPSTIYTVLEWLREAE